LVIPLTRWAGCLAAVRQAGRYTLVGFTDATFKAMRVLEGGRNADWPF
jgi:hypothetical protein